MSLGYHINVDELRKINKDVPAALIDKVKILDLLFQYKNGLLRSDIQRYISPDGLKLKTEGNLNDYLNEKRRVERLLKDLEDRKDKLINKAVVNKRTSKYVLSHTNANVPSIKYSKKELKTFKEWETLLDTYDYIPFIEDIKNIVSESGVTKNKIPAILFKSIDYKNTHYINDLYNSILSRKYIELEYESFDGTIRNLGNFAPYFLKEHNNRWYLIGKMGTGLAFKICALDRIEKLKIDARKQRFDRDHTDPKILWKYSSGIYLSWKNSDQKDTKDVPNQYEPVPISFRVKDGDKFDNIEYLKTMELHDSQEISISDKDKAGYVKVSLKMLPDADLVREIRRIGLHCVDNIEPPFFDKWVREL